MAHGSLWLFRPAETAWDDAQRLRGSTDLPAKEESLAELRQRVARLPDGPELLYHPPDEAATESARVIASRFACTVRARADLAEPDFGLLEGLSMSEFERRFESRHAEWVASPLTVIPPEGEPMADAQERILADFGAILAANPRRRIGFVLHPVALAMVRDRLARGDGARLWERVEGRAWCTQYALPPAAGDLVVG
jgi:broad specificity phosphatase PhoE